MTPAKDVLLDPSSEESQSEDDEEGWMLTEEVEKDFYKTLSQIKNKDPTIYKKDVEFFKNIPAPDKKQKKHKKTNPLTLKEYERKLVLERGGELSDEDDTFEESTCREARQTYVEEQEALKKSLKAAVDSGSSDDEGKEWGGLFRKREKTKEERKKDRESYKEWLRGQKETAGDAEAEQVMKPLHDFWTDPNLNEDDKFLRDYVVNKKFLETEEGGDERADLMEQSAGDEETEGESDENNKLPSHRFEEADQEFIKRYPRVMANSLRRKKDHRKLKREEVKERKTKEKEKKITQVKLKKKEKKKEIEEKIEELKKLTGNDQLAFENVTKDDFDLDEHDRTMKRLFDEEFYAQEDPNFCPDNIDGGEEWSFKGEEVNEGEYDETAAAEDYYEPSHCEDPDFIMDCDYDPNEAKAKVKEGKGEKSRSRRRKDKHRRTTLSEAVAREKPRFDPASHESFQQYVDQYYAIDCEDFIGDLPCRFKYRRTVPNSYGLTIEEILSADVKELERWCSIKRIQQLRPEHKERGDLKVYGRRAQDEALKRKILPSLFKDTVEEEDAAHNEKNENKTKGNDGGNEGNVKKHDKMESEEKEFVKKAKNKKNKDKKVIPTEQQKSTPYKSESGQIIKKRKHEDTKDMRKTKKIKPLLDDQHSFKNKKSKSEIRLIKDAHKNTEDPILPGMSDARLLAYGIKPKKFKNKLKYKKDTS